MSRGVLRKKETSPADSIRKTAQESKKKWGMREQFDTLSPLKPELPWKTRDEMRKGENLAGLEAQKIEQPEP